MKSEEKIKISKQFVDDFELLMKHYKCTKSEIEELKIRIKSSNDIYEQVRKSFFEIALRIRCRESYE